MTTYKWSARLLHLSTLAVLYIIKKITADEGQYFSGRRVYLVLLQNQCVPLGLYTCGLCADTTAVDYIAFFMVSSVRLDGDYVVLGHVMCVPIDNHTACMYCARTIYIRAGFLSGA